VFTLLVAAGSAWLLSTYRQHQRAAEEQAAQIEVAPKKTHRSKPVPADLAGYNPTNGIFRNDAGQPVQKAFEPSSNFTKNAVLSSKKPRTKPLPGDDIFKDVFIPKIQIKVSSPGVSGLSHSPRRYVRATIEEGGQTYTNVAVRLKGGPGSFRPLQETPAFTINFDKFAEGQTFHGLKKIHLNNSVQDRTYLKEKISRELFEAAGVPAPRAGNAIVKFNDDSPRMCVLVEGVNKQFLKRYFKDTGGNIYDGHSGSDVNGDMPTNDGENPRDKSRLRALARAAQESDLQSRMGSLEKTLDVDRFLSFLAMEMILGHWDGYTMNRNNYRIFHDRATDRMVFIPQGLDQVLTRPSSRSIFAPAVGLVARSILEIPEARERYRERVAQLTTNVFRGDAITARIHEVTARMDEAVAGHNYRAAGDSFAKRVRERAASLQNQVSPPTQPKFNTVAIAPLKDWQPKIDQGEPRLEQEPGEGNTLLHIATESFCTASWRTTRVLDSGKYRLEARIKTKGVVFPPGDQRAGAGLRISRYRTGQKNAGDHDWTPISFDFDVAEDQSEIELVCELRANQGDVWFDLESLKLKRL